MISSDKNQTFCKSFLALVKVVVIMVCFSRVCFGMAGFFFFLCALMICVKNSKDPRAKIHNG